MYDVCSKVLGPESESLQGAIRRRSRGMPRLELANGIVGSILQRNDPVRTILACVHSRLSELLENVED